MQFVTNYLENLITSMAQNVPIEKFHLAKVYMNFRQIYDINFGNDPKALIKCIPNNCQISTYKKAITIAGEGKGDLLVNRSVNFFLLCYVVLYQFWEINDSNQYRNHYYLQFQIGGQNIYSKTISLLPVDTLVISKL